jgi:hypothetical protein
MITLACSLRDDPTFSDLGGWDTVVLAVGILTEVDLDPAKFGLDPGHHASRGFFLHRVIPLSLVQ